MPNDIIFNLAFLSQILFISVWLPWRVTIKARRVIQAHPAQDYPRLYPQSPSWYERALLMFAYLNITISVIGLFFWLVYNADDTKTDYVGIVWAIFMLQGLPYILLEVFAFRTWRKMREADERTTRQATLRPRRLSDVISIEQLSILGIVFLVFCFFISWVEQFNYPWFGGIANVFIIAGTYAFMGGVIIWNLFGKSKDPYMDDEDRMRRIRHMAKQIWIVCIALTIYAMVTISLQAFDLHAYRQLAMTLYCQLLVAGYYVTIYRKEEINFEVYRGDAIASPEVSS